MYGSISVTQMVNSEVSCIETSSVTRYEPTSVEDPVIVSYVAGGQVCHSWGGIDFINLLLLSGELSYFMVVGLVA